MDIERLRLPWSLLLQLLLEAVKGGRARERTDRLIYPHRW